MSLLNYRVIQFLRDPLRGEGRNIGVIVFSQSWAGFKSIGMIDEAAKPELFGYMSVAGNSYKESIWVFGEWIEWFKDLCNEDRGNPDKINNELDALKEQTPYFSATGGGVIETGSNAPKFALGELYDELVGQPLAKPKNDFQDDVFEILKRSEITFYTEFERAVEITIESEPGKAPIVFTLDYFLDGPKKLGFKVIRFRKARRQQLTMKVNDAIHAFTDAQNSGFLDRNRCVVLCDTDKDSVHLERLKSVAMVINITKEDAHREISRIHIGT